MTGDLFDTRSTSSAPSATSGGVRRPGDTGRRAEFVREGVARRRILAAEGSCPRGAVIIRPSRPERRRAAREGRPGELSPNAARSRQASGIP